MNLTQQVTALEDTRKSKHAQLAEILQRAADEGRSTEAAEAQQFDTIESEIKTLDADLVRLRKVLRLEGANAEPVEPSAVPIKANGGNVNALQLKKTPKQLEPGIRFARYVRCSDLASKATGTRRTSRNGSTPKTSICMTSWSGGGAGSQHPGPHLAGQSGQRRGRHVC